MAKKIVIELEKVEALASRGLTVEQVSDCLGIDRKTFYNNRKKNPAIEEAFQRGRSKGIQVIANALWEKAKDGDNTAMIFYLKCHGWVEKNGLDLKVDVKQKSIKDMSDDELQAELDKYGDKS